VALSWRRDRPPAGLRANRSVAAPTVVWQSELHLHLGAPPSERAMRATPPFFGRPAPLRVTTRLIAERHTTTVHGVALAPWPRPVLVRERSPTPKRIAACVAPGTGPAASPLPEPLAPARAPLSAHHPRWPRLTLPRRTRAGVPIEAGGWPFAAPASIRLCDPDGQPRRWPQATPPPRGTRAGVPIEAGGWPFAARESIRRRDLDTLPRRSGAWRSAASRPPAEARPAPPLPDRAPPPLVWRQAPRGAAPPADEPVRRDPPASTRWTSSPPRSVLDGARISAAQVDRPVLQAASLDPALMERVTDHVIRRVEKRARIERERRGIW
jgi:hypothetical protein